MTNFERIGEPVGERKIPSGKYTYIEFDGSKWRFKGQRANIVDAVLGTHARNETAEVLAQDLEVPVEAVFEAEKFLKDYPEVIKDHHRRMLKYANEHSRR